MCYKMYIYEPRSNRNKAKKGFLEEENENRLASKKEGNILVVKMLWLQDAEI